MKKIAVIAGDGIGKEVIPEAIKVIEAAGVTFDYTNFDLGGERYLRDGTILDDATITELKKYDAILLGAIGHPEVKPGVLERGILLKLRFDLDLYINRRPFKGGHHEFEVVRENTEGPYLGKGSFTNKGTPEEVAAQDSINTRKGVERCIRYAFELTQTKERKLLTMIHKTNVLQYAGDLWQRTFDEVATEYPEVTTNYQNIDAACIYFVESPQQYSVIVTDNLFGDILTDLGGAVSGGIGLAASANLDPTRQSPSLFEPVHGSAPDIAEQNKANPIAAIISGAMLCDWLGETVAASKITAACDKILSQTTGKSTSEIVKLISSNL